MSSVDFSDYPGGCSEIPRIFNSGRERQWWSESIVSDEKVVFILIVKITSVTSFFLVSFKIFFLSFVSSSLIMLCSGVYMPFYPSWCILRFLELKVVVFYQIYTFWLLFLKYFCSSVSGTLTTWVLDYVLQSLSWVIELCVIIVLILYCYNKYFIISVYA